MSLHKIHATKVNEDGVVEEYEIDCPEDSTCAVWHECKVEGCEPPEDANELSNWVQCEECLSANKYVREHNYENAVSFDDFSEWAHECSQLKDDEGDAARAWAVRIASR